MSPILYAFCRDCLGEESPAPSCWRCAGSILYRVEDDGEADFVFGLVHGGAAFGLGMQPTARFLAWLREVSDTT